MIGVHRRITRMPVEVFDMLAPEAKKSGLSIKEYVGIIIEANNYSDPEPFKMSTSYYQEVEVYIDSMHKLKEIRRAKRKKSIWPILAGLHEGYKANLLLQ